MNRQGLPHSSHVETLGWQGEQQDHKVFSAIIFTESSIFTNSFGGT